MSRDRAREIQEAKEGVAQARAVATDKGSSEEVEVEVVAEEVGDTRRVTRKRAAETASTAEQPTRKSKTIMRNERREMLQNVMRQASV